MNIKSEEYLISNGESKNMNKFKVECDANISIKIEAESVEEAFTKAENYFDLMDTRGFYIDAYDWRAEDCE